jgi:2-phosphosulfolactate phosphatase
LEQNPESPVVGMDQAEFDLRCEWCLAGLLALGPVSGVAVIVDVFSFSTAVDVALSRGASVFPYRWKDASAEDSAARKAALLASGRCGKGGYSLSPASLQSIPPGSALVLPSPNGGTLSLLSPCRTTFTACLRNSEAVAQRIPDHGRTVAVIPAGEQWKDGTLRPCIEDWIGAGAVLAALPGRRSPEAEMAVAAFERFRHDLERVLSNCSSGKELIELGFPEDVSIAADYGSSSAIPILREGCYVNEAIETAWQPTAC